MEAAASSKPQPEVAASSTRQSAAPAARAAPGCCRCASAAKADGGWRHAVPPRVWGRAVLPPALGHAVPPPALGHAVPPPALRHAVLPPAWGRHAVATGPCRQGAVLVAATAPGRRAESVTARIGRASSSSTLTSWHAHLTWSLSGRRRYHRPWRAPMRVRVRATDT